MKMIKKILTIAIPAILALNACKQAPKKENAEMPATGTVEKTGDDIVKTTSIGKDGNKLMLTFNNTKGTTTLDFNGEKIELVTQKPASGIWYKNDHYELRGKGNDMELTKDGKVVFTHTDDIVSKSLKNKEGQTLDITFNNTTNEEKIYLNGGDQVDLVGQKPASGIWYKNNEYDLRGKGDKLELTKNGKTVFKNEK